MIFYKTSSFGNDFIAIELGRLKHGGGDRGLLASATPRRPLGGLAREICDRQSGVGADGVVYYSVGKAFPGEGDTRLRRLSPGPSVDFRIFNRDGGEAELSGNGMAGLAAVVFQRRLAASPLTLHAAIGPRRVELLGRRGALFRLSVEIGLPDFSARDFFPFLKEGRPSYALEGQEFHPVSVGNPHAVVIGREMPPAGQLAALGKRIEGHAMFPKRVNVEFVQRTGDDSCRVFFYERGVGPTRASSTGSAAVFAVLRRLGLAGERLLIDPGPAGGEADGPGAGHPAGADAAKIEVSWKEGIFIRNVTRLVCRGEYFL